MKRYVHLTVALACAIFFSVSAVPLHAQLGAFNPNDTVKTYDPTKPPVKPASGKVGKWVRTPRVSWSTSSFKCYIYNNMPFRLKFPKNYDSTKSYPVLIFFHGRGEFGDIYDNEFHLYLGGEAHRNAVDNGKFNGFLLYPQHTSEFWSSGNVTNVYNLVDKILIPQKMVDPFRVYVNGLSAGATTTWTFLAKYTKLVAATTPISSAANYLFDSAQKYKFTPIYHFQGGLDPDPTPSAARSLGNKILGIGGNYKYREFANRGHDCWYQAWSDPDYYPFYNRAHKANPWPLFGRTEFCEGDTVGLTLGVTAGFDGYEWRKNGAVIAGATSNELQVSEFGTYDCRIKRGTEWSVWSPQPVTIRKKPLTDQPAIVISGLASNVLPAPDGNTSVTLEAPEGYETYKWQQEGNSTVLSTTRFLTASTPGNYKVQVTEKYGCGINTTVTEIPSATKRVEAETYSAMSGVQKETCGDVGGGQNVGYIDRGNWMEYNINAPSTGNYTFQFRVASGLNNAQFEVRNETGNALATVKVPNTGGWQKYVTVTVTLPLTMGDQKLRMHSVIADRWNFNWFDFTNPAVTLGTADGFSRPFPVIDANAANGPDAVSNLTATGISKTAVQLQWTQSASPAYNETGFEVYEATAAQGPYAFKTKTAADASGVIINNLVSGSVYFYKVRAVNNNAASATSNAVSAATQADVTPPSTPGNLRVGIITKHSVELLWNASTDDVGVVFYDVYVNGVKWYAIPKSNTKASIFNLLPNKTYTFVMKARDQAGNASSYTNEVSAKTLTGSLKLDPGMANANPANYSVYINMNLDNPATSPWNNTGVLPSEGTVWKNFKNYAGNVSGLNMAIVDNFSGYNPSGVNTGNNSGVYPDNVMRSSYYCDKGQTARLHIYDLSLNHTYSFVFFGSRNGTGDRTSVYKIGEQSVSLNASMNSTNTVQIDNVVPDQNGYVSIEISLGPNSIYAYLNALVVKAYSLDPMGTKIAAKPAVTLTEESNLTVARAYPNPVVNDVNLNIALSKSVPMLSVRITDAAGSVLSTQQFSNVPQGIWQKRIPLQGKASQPGVYFIHISGLPEGKNQVIKILKVK